MATIVVFFYVCFVAKNMMATILSFSSYFCLKRRKQQFFNPFATNKVIITMSSSSSFQIEKIIRQ
jgi:hypothetical protein